MFLISVLMIVITITAYSWAEEKGYSNEAANGDCPPSYFLNKEGECSFSHKLQPIVNKFSNTSELEIGFCMTLTNSSQVLAQCPYSPMSDHNFSQYHSIYQVLPIQLDLVNDSICAPFNRKGFLCSECKDNYGLAAYRFYGLICVKCSNSIWKWLLYILLLFIPPTILFLTFLILDVKVHSGGLSAFIFFAQTTTEMAFLWPSLISIPQRLFGYWPIQILLGLYGIWSFNLMQFMIPPFCVSTHLTTLQLVSLGYVSSVYPLVLCIITYYLVQLHAGGNWLLEKVWRPFRKCLINSNRKTSIESSVIHTFGTFVLLSYGNNLFVSKTLLRSYALVEQGINTNQISFPSPRSVDLGVTYFDSIHAPYGALGILGGIITIILPLVIVIIYPTRVFPKLIQCCGLRRWHAIRMFMEVFISSYEDGTKDGKRDCRIFAAIYLSGQVIVATGLPWVKFSGLVPYFWLSISVPYITFAVVLAFVKPHRKWSHNIADVLILLLMAKIPILLHVAFETSISDHILRVIMLIVLIDLAIPQVILISYFCFKLVYWFCYNTAFMRAQMVANESQSLLSKNNY